LNRCPAKRSTTAAATQPGGATAPREGAAPDLGGTSPTPLPGSARHAQPGPILYAFRVNEMSLARVRLAIQLQRPFRRGFSARFSNRFLKFWRPSGYPDGTRFGGNKGRDARVPPPAPCGADVGGCGETGPGTDGIIPAPGLPAQTYEDCRRWSASRAGQLGSDDWR
jgi:hypothetical protein